LGWLDKHERIKQLTIQSVIQALSIREETVKEALVTHEKLPILVHELILIELWRERIFPQLLKETLPTGICIYPILYHESSCINLLETVLFHPEAAETLGDSSLDLADYCLRTLNNVLVQASLEGDDEDDEEVKSRHLSGDSTTTEMDLKNQSNTLLMGISIKCLCTLRYIIENIETLGHGLVSRLVVSFDTPMLLTDLIVAKPWRKEYWREGKILDFNPVENQWKEIHPSSRLLISPTTDLQAWLALYLLLKNNRILSSYELYESRKNNLLKLRPYLNDVALEQVPILGEFSLFLNQLAVTSGGAFGSSSSSLLLEMVPPIRDHLEKIFDKDHKKILNASLQELVHSGREKMIEKAKKLASAYDVDQFKAAMPEVHPCAKCGREAYKKCSKCKEIWYCARECQVSHWNEHKKNCKI
jgi:hypothetical protein